MVRISENSTPVRRDDLSCRVIEDEALLHDVRRSSTHRLNSTAYRIWEQCDGTQTCASIADRMAESWQTSLEQARADVIGAVREMARYKLVNVLR